VTEDGKPLDIDPQSFGPDGDRPTPEQRKKRLGEIFHMVDAQLKKDGYVTKEELTHWIAMVQKKFIRNDSETLWKATDLDKDGKVTFQEFLKHSYVEDKTETEQDKKERAKSKARDERIFAVADANKDNALDAAEFFAFNHPEYNDVTRRPVLMETLNEVDKDGDGYISKEEYINDIYPEHDRVKDKGKEPEWVKQSRDRFAEKDRDKNQDGRLDEEEITNWLFPDPKIHLRKEVDHMFKEADINNDGRITKDDMLAKWEVFANGSTGSTHFSDIFNGGRHDEL